MTQQPTPKDEPTNMTTCGLCGAPRPMATTCKNCPMPKQEQPGSFEGVAITTVADCIMVGRNSGEDVIQDQATVYENRLIAAHNSTLEAAKREAVREVLEQLRAYVFKYEAKPSLQHHIIEIIKTINTKLANLNPVTKGTE